MSAGRSGYVYAVSAYLMWGLFPLYWRLLRPSTAVELLAHRIVWSLVFVLGLVAVTRAWRRLRGLSARRPGSIAASASREREERAPASPTIASTRSGQRGADRAAQGLFRPRTLLVVAVASVLIAVNWGTYIYGVNADRVVETSLGYFISPLVTVLIGVVVLRERLTVAQWSAIGVGALAVGVLTVDYGHVPVIALMLAATFGLYGLAKKRLSVPAVDGFALESGLLAVPASGYLALHALRGESTFGSVGPTHTALLVASGVVTAVPLLAFAGATSRIPLSAIGLLQYIAPVIQFACGVLILGEPMPPARLGGFGLVWLALTIFIWDGINRLRSATRTSRTEPAMAVAADGIPPRR